MNELWNAIADEVTREFPTAGELGRALVRMAAALLLTAVIGWEREEGHKSAGLRTHMLVGAGAALFTFMAIQSGASPGDTTRVLQGIATGIGFIGGGVILKNVDENRVHGLTTAASIWMTAAIGAAVGLGKIGIATVGVLFAWVTLFLVRRIERFIRSGRKRGVGGSKEAGG